MPLTIPTHPVAVLPLKLWRPRAFDGVALVVGSIAPDVAYAYQGLGLTAESHTVAGLFWWALPVTLVCTWLIRLAAADIAVHLPGRCGDYGVLSRVGHRWYVTVPSALLGAVSHLLWDSFTHPLSAWLASPMVDGVPWFRVFQAVSNLIGFVVAAAVAIHIGRRRLLVDWHGPAPTRPRRPRLFWSVAASGAGALAAVAAVLPAAEVFSVSAVRVMLAVAVGLLVAAATTQRAGWGHGRVPDRARHDGGRTRPG